MMRLFCIMIGAALSSIVHAQMLVDGRKAAYDSLTNTLLATVPERCFHQTAEFTIELQDCWQSCTIDGEPVIGSHLFSNIEAQKGYELMLTDTLGNSVERRLEFTFLPIIELQGSFSNTYVDTLLLFTDPTAHRTDTLAASIKWRGGTTNTASKHKRNYKIKLSADTTLLGMRNDDSWILDAGQPDVFRLRNRIAMDLWNDMAPQPYYADREPTARNGVSGRVVEVFLNDEYRGFYNFSESMDRKQLQIKKIKSDTGQIRGCLYKAFNWVSTQMFDTLTVYDNTQETLRGFEVKYPDLQDSDTTDWAPLVEANNFARTSTDEYLVEHVEEYFDVEPILYYTLFVSSINAYDNNGKNMYWAVYDKNIDRRLTLAPWDLDASFGQRWGAILTGFETNENPILPEYLNDVDVYIFYRLFKSNYHNFNDRLNQRYKEMRQPGGVLTTDSLISRFTTYYQLIKNSGAAQRETARWSGDTDLKGEEIDFDREYDYICQWIMRHMQLLDENTFPLYYNDAYFELEQGINSPIAKRPPSNTIYDLQGRPVSNRQSSNRHLPKGIYISHGRKYIVK